MPSSGQGENESQFHRKQRLLCEDLTFMLSQVEESSRILAESMFSAHSLKRFRYISRLLTDEALFLKEHGATVSMRLRVRHEHFTAFRVILKAFEGEFASIERAALSGMASSGLAFEKIVRARLEIRAQLWKLRAAGVLYLAGLPNAKQVSESAVASLARIVRPKVVYINAF